MPATPAVQIPGYVAGTWDIDATHSTVGFSVRHMMVSKVRGYFRTFSGVLVTAEDPTASTVEATIDMDSIDTRQEQRSEEHTSELQSRQYLVCRLLLEKKTNVPTAT